jgi:hypothetical protein
MFQITPLSFIPGYSPFPVLSPTPFTHNNAAIPLPFKGRTKDEDIIRALLLELGIVTPTGELHYHLSGVTALPLNDEEMGRLNSLLHTCFRLCSPYFDFGKETNIYYVLSELETRGGAGVNLDDISIVIMTIIEMETRGSVSLKIAGSKYILRFFSHLLLTAQFSEEKTKEIIAKIFTEKVCINLDRKLNRPLCDEDILTTLLNNIDPRYHELFIQQVGNLYIKILSDLIALNDEQKEKALEALIKKCPPPDWNWNWLKPGEKYHKDFNYHMVRNLLFAEYLPLAKENVFAEVKFGHHQKRLIDFVNGVRLLRHRLFPQMTIPFSTLFKPLQYRKLIVPSGDFAQAMLDKVMGLYRPDLSVAKEADFKGSVVRAIRGEICPIAGGEYKLSSDVKNIYSQSKSNPYIKTLLEKNPTIKDKLHDHFHEYLVLLLKDIVEGHFNSNSNAALIATLHIGRLYGYQLTPSQMEHIYENMSPYWSSATDLHPELKIFTRIFTSKQLSFVQWLNIIRLFLFIRMNFKNPDGASVEYHLRDHDQLPFIEATYYVGDISYSLLLDCYNTQAYAYDAMQSTSQILEEKTLFQDIIFQFCPESVQLVPGCSYLIPDLMYFNADPFLLEQYAQVYGQSIYPAQNLTSIYLYLTAQALQRHKIPLDVLLKKIPLILCTFKNEKKRIIAALESLISKIKTNALLDSLPFEEPLSKVTAVWIQNLMTIPEHAYLAYGMWQDYIRDGTYTDEQKNSLTTNLLQYTFTHNRQICISILAAQHRIVSLSYKIKLLKQLILSGVFNPQQLMIELYTLDRLICVLAYTQKFDEDVDQILEIIPQNVLTQRLTRLKKQRVAKQQTIPDTSFDVTVEIKMLLKTNPSLAVEQFLILLNENTISQRHSDELFSAIIKKLVASRDYTELSLFVSSDDVRLYLTKSQDATMDLVHVLTELSKEHQTWNVCTITLEILLSTNYNHHKSKEIYQKTALILLIAFRSPYLFQLTNLKKTISKCANSFLSALFIQEDKQIFCRIYDICIQLGLDNGIYDEYRMGAIDVLNNMIVEAPLPEDMLLTAKRIVAQYIFTKGSEQVKLIKLLKVLVEHLQGFNEKIYFLNTIQALEPLSQSNDLDLLFHLIDQELNKNNNFTAVILLGYFKNKVLSTPKALATFNRLIETFRTQKKFAHLSDTLIANPFSDKTSSKDYIATIREILEEVITNHQNNLYCQQAVTIIKLVGLYPLHEGTLIHKLFTWLSEVDHSEISELMWKYLEDNGEQFEKNIRVELWLLVFKSLKYRPKKFIRDLIANEDYILKKLPIIPLGKRFEMFDSLWDAWMKALKSPKSGEGETLLETILNNYDTWLHERLDSTSLEQVSERSIRVIQLLLQRKNENSLNNCIELFIQLSLMNESKAEDKTHLNDKIRKIFYLIYQACLKVQSPTDDFIHEILYLVSHAKRWHIPAIKLFAIVELLINYPTLSSVNLGIDLLTRFLDEAKTQKLTAEDLQVLKSVDVKKYIDLVFSTIESKRGVIIDLLYFENSSLIIKQEQRKAFIMLWSEILITTASKTKKTDELNKAITFIKNNFNGLSDINVHEKDTRTITVSYVMVGYFICLMIMALESGDFSLLTQNMDELKVKAKYPCHRNRLEIVLEAACETILSWNGSGKIFVNKAIEDHPIYIKLIDIISLFFKEHVLEHTLTNEELHCTANYFSALLTRYNTNSEKWFNELLPFMKDKFKTIDDTSKLHAVLMQLDARLGDAVPPNEWVTRLVKYDRTAHIIVLVTCTKLKNHFLKCPETAYKLNLHGHIKHIILRCYPFISNFRKDAETLCSLIETLHACMKSLTNSLEQRTLCQDTNNLIFSLYDANLISFSLLERVFRKCLENLISTSIDFITKFFLIQHLRQLFNTCTKDKKITKIELISHYASQIELLINVREQVCTCYNLHEKNKIMPLLENDPLINLTILQVRLIHDRLTKVSCGVLVYLMYYDLAKYLIIDMLRKRNPQVDNEDKYEMIVISIKSFVDIVERMKELPTHIYEKCLTNFKSWTDEFQSHISNSAALRGLGEALNKCCENKFKKIEKAKKFENPSLSDLEFLEIETVSKEMSDLKIETKKLHTKMVLALTLERNKKLQDLKAKSTPGKKGLT